MLRNFGFRISDLLYLKFSDLFQIVRLESNEFRISDLTEAISDQLSAISSQRENISDFGFIYPEIMVFLGKTGFVSDNMLVRRYG